MLYFIYGTNIVESEKKLDELLQTLKSKRPAAEVFLIDNENFSAGKLEELLYSQGLFEKKYVVKTRRLLELKDSREVVVDNLETISQSDNAFVLWEEKVDARVVKKIEKHATKVWFYNLDNFTARDDKFIFSLGEALGSRRRRDLWLAISKARLREMPAEQVFWQLMNTLQNIILVSSGEDLSSLKIHPYVLSKTKSQAVNFSDQEVLELIENLFTLYHESRRGGLDLYDRLEKFSLEL